MEKSEKKVTWAEYRPIYEKSLAIEAREHEIRQDENWYKDEALKAEAMKLMQVNSRLERQLRDMRPYLVPEEGVPCTVYYYSDRSKAYVAKVISPKEIEVQQNGLYSGRKVYTLRKNGSWIEKGSSIRDWSTHLALGYAYDYYDMSF